MCVAQGVSVSLSISESMIQCVCALIHSTKRYDLTVKSKGQAVLN